MINKPLAVFMISLEDGRNSGLCTILTFPGSSQEQRRESELTKNITSVHRVLSVYPGFKILTCVYFSSSFSAPVSVKKDEANLLDLQASKPHVTARRRCSLICIDAREEGKGRLISWGMWSEFQALLTDPTEANARLAIFKE